MVTSHLRKVGGSVMLAVPPRLLELLHLEVGTAVELSIEGERLVVERGSRPRYSLAELLAQCAPEMPLEAEERDWLESRPAGNELL